MKFYLNFIFVWRVLNCLANCDNSTTDHPLTGWGEWKRSPADSGKWTGDLEKQSDSQLACGACSRESSLRAACHGGEEVLDFPAGKGSARPGEVGCFPFGFTG